jgi:hypothetical protein
MYTKILSTGCNEQLPLRSALPPEILVGRRIVDFQYFAEQMQCNNCGILLHLKDFCGTERHYGLASEIPLKCPGCKILVFVYTSRDSSTKNLQRDGRARVYDSNSKLALGIFALFYIQNILIISISASYD